MMTDSSVQGWFWLIIALCGAIGEVVLPSFFMIFVSFAAPCAAVLAFLGAPWTWQIFAFSVMLGLGVFVFRPLYAKKFQKKDELPLSRVTALVGKIGVVTEAINPQGGLGRVSVEGEDWAARASGPIPKDTSVRVTGFDSIVLIIERA
jgi:membrane protein implicated in regulation of membrane protease activity